MRRSFSFLFITVALLGCGAKTRATGSGARTPVARPLDVYRQLGMLAGPPEFPAVARLTTLAGPADSTWLLLSMSMPNSALRFQRSDSGFVAEYRVHLAVLRDSAQVRQFERREVVRVGGFAETTRTEESIIFQDVAAVLPGRYIVRLQIADLNSSRAFRTADTLTVPAYPRDQRLSTPLLVYQAKPRTAKQQRPEFLVNPRNTIAYGSDNPRAYVELYGAPEPGRLSMRVVDEAGSVLWTAQPNISEGNAEIRHALVDLPASALPIGRLWLETVAEPGAKPLLSPFLISISDQWMVANFDDVLHFIQYIADPVELDSLRRANGTERRTRWDKFWARRDPLPATPINEYREQFFERVRIATEQFAETGKPGWETDRGEVYIVLGAPDNTLERSVGNDAGAQPNLIEWLYESLPGGSLVIQFFDRGNFGHYEMTPSSEAAFRTVATRIRPGN